MPERKKERAELLSKLKAGNHILMIAPRRAGKTWTLKRAEEDGTLQNHIVINFDAEGAQTEKDFYSQLASAIRKKLGLKSSFWSRIQQGVDTAVHSDHGQKKSWQIFNVNPKSSFEALIIELLKKENPISILVDEIPIFCLKLDPDQLANFLDELRYFRNTYPSVTWLFTGSIGLSGILAEMGLSDKINDFSIYEFSAFCKPKAKQFVTSQLKKPHVPYSCSISEEGFDYLVDELGWLSPYYLLKIIEAIDISEAKELELADVSTALEKLLSPSYRDYFNTWQTRLKKRPNTNQILKILEVISQANTGEAIETIMAFDESLSNKSELRRHLYALEVEGYIECKEGRFKFKSGLLRRWWRRFVIGD